MGGGGWPNPKITRGWCKSLRPGILDIPNIRQGISSIFLKASSYFIFSPDIPVNLGSKYRESIDKVYNGT